jgi:predicted RNA binding protein YcfA (HicA-like mRNA interferase family)
MAKKEKLIAKLQRGSSFEWRELVTLLNQLGWEKLEGAGSRVKFQRDGVLIELHRPHPGNELKAYAKKDIINILRQEGDL